MKLASSWFSSLGMTLSVCQLLSACAESDAAEQDAGPSTGGADASAEESDAGTGEVSDAAAPDPGALVAVRMESSVGVLLDEIPTTERARLVDLLAAEGDAFWQQRAAAQTALATYRLVYRDFFYDEEEGKGQLPLPPRELWTFEITSEPEVRTIDGHDLVVVDYVMTSTLLTDYASPGESDPELEAVGGTWSEGFVFPADPELLLQRTGYACMDEEEFPPNSVDAENVATFYDHECEAAVEEDELQNSDCHITEHPDEDCVEALERGVGSIEVELEFERLPWDIDVANEVRVGDVTFEQGADLSVIEEGLENHRIIYRFIEADSCALAEGCVGGRGWRRLLQFDASVKNLGAQALNIGEVDYYLESEGTALGDHHIFEFSECHQHYHFSHYGDFVLQTASDVRGDKQAFCLQSTNRYSNNEASPLTHPYGGCEYQGMQAGWGDDYGAGLDCQWIDITDIGPQTVDLSFVSNPDGFLCEGVPALDENGLPEFEPTEFETPTGETVDRPVCDFTADWDENNAGRAEVAIPEAGGLIHTPCARGQLGPLRDCGFRTGAGELESVECEPGTQVSIECEVPEGAPPVVVRACEYSAVLDQGVACVYLDALANEVMLPGTHSLQVPCATVRDAEDEAGRFSLYAAPLVPSDDSLELNCVE